MRNLVKLLIIGFTLALYFSVIFITGKFMSFLLKITNNLKKILFVHDVL